MRSTSWFKLDFNLNALEDRIQFFRDLPRTMTDLAVKVMRDAIPQIEDKIVEQLKRGERGDGSSLPNYSPRSVAVFSKPFGPIKLFDTGDFYFGVHAEVTDTQVTINDTDYKEEMLVTRYRESILELQERSIDELKQDVLIPYMESEVLRLQ